MSLFSNLFHREVQQDSGSALEEASDIKKEEDESSILENPGGKNSNDAVQRGTLKFETKDPETVETYEVLEREILPAKIICPDCGGITLEGLEFCDKCGGELL
jgi:hypothetical protein